MLAPEEHAFLQRIAIAVSDCVGATAAQFPSGLAVKASGADGFDMTVMIEGGRYALYFDNWTEEFVSGEAAWRMFEAALSGDARLRVDTLSGRRWRWALERRDETGHWIEESAVSHVIWRVWGEREMVYLRNTFPRRTSIGREDVAPLTQ